MVRMRNIFNDRGQLITKRLREMGLGIAVEPTGAFYILGNIKHYEKDSYTMAFDILKEAKVGVTPGIDFGENCEGYLRFSYANSMERVVSGP